ncbi:MAG: hypothetical protein Q7T16_06100 [Candidatus Burarchaeum sp.]|nr:hypothetical protein [Candidatus Burarchaeum sp.]MDO8340200.1 hypothetical protein [Candidatus Burarchaeum sp.]
MMEEELVGVNAELRYITVELMKIAAQRNITFDEIAQEYIGNVYCLDRSVRKCKIAEPRAVHKVAAKERQ